MSVIDGSSELLLSEISIDEAIVVEAAGAISFRNVIITQLDVRATDIRAFSFGESCHVLSLIADAGTRLPESFPRPQRIQLPDRVVTEPGSIGAWISEHSPIPDAAPPPASAVPLALRSHGLFELVQRVGRHRPFWMREGEERDRSARKILEDPNWTTLRQLLEKHELLTVRRDVQAGGSGGEFFHVKRKGDLLNENTSDPKVAAFYKDVIATATV